MAGMVVGYARISNTDQTACLDAQERALRAAGAEKVFSEQVSSVAERAELARNSHTGEGWSTAWGANRRGMARTDERMSVARVGSRMSNTASPAALLGCMLTVRCLVRVRWQHVAIAHERGRIRSARDRRMTSLP